MTWKTFWYGPTSDYILIDTYSTQNFWYAFVTSQVCRLLRTKYVPKLHGGELPRRLAQNPRLCRMVFAHSYLNVAPSGYLLKAFHEAGFENTIYIPNTIDICNYPFKPRQSVAPKLLWVRSFAPIYNPQMALKVLKLVAMRHPKAQLCMVGPDKNGMIDRLKDKAAHLGLNVTFTGKLSKEAWTKLSQDYDIFVNTTHYDNTPVSVIEAMALGLPVVSTNVGGLPYLLENKKTALLVNDGDAEQMAWCIEMLVASPELSREIAGNAVALVRDFDSEKVKWQWLEILK
jgi:glycosyltransferase involved in cell wall biosynthesis